MQWECHECGERHPSIPEACARCGARPEIVANVWRCAHCGREAIPASSSRCPGCGAERGLGVQTAVDASARLEGQRARQLAEGEWRYCAYCDVQVPPVDEQGRANEVCPTCQGPLSEAARRAAAQRIAAAEAGQYRDEATEQLGAAPRPPTPAPRPRRRGALVVVGLLLLVVVSVVLYIALRGPSAFVVAGRAWTRSIAVERFGPTPGEDWAAAVPADARDRRCAPAVHHHDRVPDGVERYTEREATGRRCVAHEYEKKGGVSVKQCARWETTYRTVTRTRTRYRSVPVMRPRCRYTVDRWRTARTITASGRDAELPRWPSVTGLAAAERAGARSERYELTLRDEDGDSKPYVCASLAEWQRFPPQTQATAKVSLTGKLSALQLAR